MKSMKLSFVGRFTGLFLGSILICLNSCNEIAQELVPEENVITQEAINLNDLLDILDENSGIVLVQRNASIQNALDRANPGDIVFLESGIYRESVTINKSDIKLIGSGSISNEPVIIENTLTDTHIIGQGIQNVELVNIQLKNYVYEQSTELSSARRSKNKLISNFSRSDLGNGIAHYEFEVKMGPGEFDVIGIHRVVRERRPYCPVKTTGDIFMIHGGINTFEAIFLVGGAEMINEKTSSPYFLASKNIDVWGIDMSWTKIPIETPDFSFMKDWDMERDIDHALKAMTIARLIRGFTHQGFQPMNLMGFSYGVDILYGSASRETQLPKICRNIKGLIAVDQPLKYSPDDDALRVLDCERAASFQLALDTGTYQNEDGVGFRAMGELALYLPDDPSPIFPFDELGFTNRQTLMFVMSNPDNPPLNYWHFFGGNQDEWFHTDPLRLFRMAVDLPPYMPMRVWRDFYACLCDEEDVSFDDYLAEITLPIYNLSAGGGEGIRVYYTSEQTASPEVTNLLVSVNTDPAIDYGHADLWFGNEADYLVWEELYNWLINHSSRPIW